MNQITRLGPPVVGAALLALAAWLGSHVRLPAGDFVEYWSTGRLNLVGRDPYDYAGLTALQRDYRPGDKTIQVYNPPWALPLFEPVAVLGHDSARALWLVLGLGLVLVSADAAWHLFGGRPEHRAKAWALALALYPTLMALRMGQIVPLVFAGVVAFLHYTKQSRGFLAGLALLALAAKPHLVYLLGAAVVLWSIDGRRWSVLAGAAVGVAAATGLALATNPHVLAQFYAALTESPPSQFVTPTVGCLLRLVFGWQHAWLQFLPPAAGLVWVVWHYLRNRRDWDWQRQAPLLVMASLLTSSYGAWVFDLVLLLVPVLAVAARLEKGGGRRGAWLAGYVGVNVVAFVMGWSGYCDVNTLWFMWMTPLALIAYRAAARRDAALVPV